MNADERCDVLILGAGAAGIGAARRLLEAGSDVSVIVLEARDRSGGRAWTSDELGCGLDLDHGGKWIHGSTSRANPMTQLALRYDIPTTAQQGHGNTAELRRKKRRCGNITRVVLCAEKNSVTASSISAVPNRKAETAARLLFKQFCQFGKQSLVAPLARCLPEEASFKDCLVEIANREMPGKSFSEWLEVKARKALRAAGNAEKIRLLIRQTIALLRLYIYERLENYEGCRLDQCSFLYGFDGSILPGKNADVAGGYGKLVQVLASSMPIDIRYNHLVTSVDRSNPQGVAVVCMLHDGCNTEKRFVARLGCIVALPLGVLQRCATSPYTEEPLFIPPLAEHLQGAVSRLAMCLMNKIEILFPSLWWPNGTGTLAIASENKNAPDEFPLTDMPWSQWIVEEDDPPALVCYATGLFAERIEAMPNEAIEKEAVEVLRLAFLGSSTGIAHIPNPLRTHVTRWRSDPYARGSWTFFKCGTKGMDDVSTFQNFNSEMGGEEKLYFAGEHTCDGRVTGLDMGTIHGAYLSGRLAAEELMKNCLDDFS